MIVIIIIIVRAITTIIVITTAVVILFAIHNKKCPKNVGLNFKGLAGFF